MRYVAMLALICLASATLNARADDKKEVAKLDGKWVATGFAFDGTEVPAQTLKDIPWYWEVENGKVLSLRPGRGGVNIYKEKLEVVLDPSKDGKSVDLIDVEKKETSKGIYKLDGDTFTICIPTKPTGDRPTEFNAQKGSNCVMITWKRVKN